MAPSKSTTALSAICPVCRMNVGVGCEDHNGLPVATHRPRREIVFPGLAVTRLEAELAAAQKVSDKASRARAALPAGSPRARVTSANARWANAAEHRDRIAAQLEAARARHQEVA